MLSGLHQEFRFTYLNGQTLRNFSMRERKEKCIKEMRNDEIQPIEHQWPKTLMGPPQAKLKFQPLATCNLTTPTWMWWAHKYQLQGLVLGLFPLSDYTPLPCRFLRFIFPSLPSPLLHHLSLLQERAHREKGPAEKPQYKVFCSFFLSSLWISGSSFSFPLHPTDWTDSWVFRFWGFLKFLPTSVCGVFFLLFCFCLPFSPPQSEILWVCLDEEENGGGENRSQLKFVLWEGFFHMFSPHPNNPSPDFLWKRKLALKHM